jgi:hypothetical protein
LTGANGFPVTEAGFSWSPLTDPWYKQRIMRCLRFMPLAFIAGVHGFPMFVSYLAVVAAILHVARRFRA